MKKPHQKAISLTSSAEYGGLIGGIAELLEVARRTAARTVNALMTATYWEIGRRIVEFEQGGEKRAEYGEGLMARLADDLTARFGRGFSRQNLQRFRLFYLSQPAEKICSTLSSKLNGGIGSTPSNELGEATIGLPNKVLAREYKLALPDEKRLAAEIEKTRDLLERRTRK